MSKVVLTGVLTSISALILVCAVKLNIKHSQYLSATIRTVVFKFVTAIVVAVSLKSIGMMVVIIWIVGVKSTLDVMSGLVTDFLLAYLWEMVRFTPVGAFVALADASTQIRNKKFIRCSIAAGITSAAMHIIILPDGQQPIFVILLACAIGSPIVGIAIASINTFPENDVITRVGRHLIGGVRAYPKITVIGLMVVVLVAFQFLHRTSRVFLTLSSWREVSINYSEITATKNSPVALLMLKLLDYLPVGAADKAQWMYFKSDKIKLDFTIVTGLQPDKAPAGQQVEMIVSRVDGDLFSGDELLEQLLINKSDFKPELVYRGKVSTETFSVEAPKFACSVYNAIGKATGSLEIVVTSAFRKTIEVSKINSVPLFPGTKNITASADWINVRASEGILGFIASADRGVGMFCRAGRNSSNIPPFNIRITSDGLANPIVIGGSGGSSKSRARPFGSLPGFIIEVRNREGRVGIGNFRVGSNSIALGSSDFRFLPGKLSRIVARYPNGKMKIDADDIIPIDLMDEMALEGSELELSYLSGEELAVQGQSKNIVRNGRSLSKPLLPDWIKELISKVVSLIK